MYCRSLVTCDFEIPSISAILLFRRWCTFLSSHIRVLLSNNSCCFGERFSNTCFRFLFAYKDFFNHLLFNTFIFFCSSILIFSLSMIVSMELQALLPDGLQFLLISISFKGTLRRSFNSLANVIDSSTVYPIQHAFSLTRYNRSSLYPS